MRQGKNLETCLDLAPEGEREDVEAESSRGGGGGRRGVHDDSTKGKFDTRASSAFSTTQWLCETLSTVPSTRRPVDLALDVIKACRQSDDEVEISHSLVEVLGDGAATAHVDVLFELVSRAQEIRENVTSEDLTRFEAVSVALQQSQPQPSKQSLPDTYNAQEPYGDVVLNVENERSEMEKSRVSKEQRRDHCDRSSIRRFVESNIRRDENSKTSPPHNVDRSDQQDRISPADAPRVHHVTQYSSGGEGVGGGMVRPGAEHVYPLVDPARDPHPHEYYNTTNQAEGEDGVAIPIAAFVVQDDDDGSHRRRPHAGDGEGGKKSKWCQNRCLVLVLILVIMAVATGSSIFVVYQNSQNVPTAFCSENSKCENDLVCDKETNQCVECTSNDDCYGALPFCHEGTKTCCGCLQNSDCDDYLFCNGVETCKGLVCVAGSDPCTPNLPVCDESTTTCVECLDHTHCLGDLICASDNMCRMGSPCTAAGDCDDGQYCNGLEQCKKRVCAPGPPPCSEPRPHCDEEVEKCFECITDKHCPESGSFCNPNICRSGQCVTGSDPCSDTSQYCDEAMELCVDCFNDDHCFSPRSYCNEDTHACVECTKDRHCNDGNYCSGEEKCKGGVCQSGSDPCLGSKRPYCIEDAETCYECLNNEHCQGNLPLCDVKIGLCVGCEMKWSKLLANDGSAYDGFGYSVSLSGDTAVIGANILPEHDPSSGSAYIFSRFANTWTQEARLLPDDGSGENEFGCTVYDDGDVGCHEFGYSVGIDGDTVVVGAKGYSFNSAYIYIRCASCEKKWIQQTKLIPDDGTEGDGFGWSVAVQGNTVVVGAPWADNGGTVYVFSRSGDTWTQSGKLLSRDRQWGDEFGVSVAIDGDTIAVGSEGNGGEERGAAYIFTKAGTTWNQQAKLLPKDGAKGDAFGCSVAIDGNSVIAGARHDEDNGSLSGSAYVFSRCITCGNKWTEQAKLLPTDKASDNHDFFGFSVAIQGDTAIVGAKQDDNKNGNVSGSAYLFARSGTTWTQQDKLLPTKGGAFDRFGSSAALHDKTVVVGAYSDDENGQSSGSAYAIDLC